MPRRLLAALAVIAVAAFSLWHFGLHRQQPVTLWAPVAEDPLDVYLRLDHPAITIDADAMPLDEFVVELERQSGVPIDWSGGLVPSGAPYPVTLRANDESLRSVLLRAAMLQEMTVSVVDGRVTVHEGGDGYMVRPYQQGDFPFQQPPENIHAAIVYGQLMNVDSMDLRTTPFLDGSAWPTMTLLQCPTEDHVVLARVQQLVDSPDVRATRRGSQQSMVRISAWGDLETERRWFEDPIEFAGDNLSIDQVLDVIDKQSDVALQRELDDAGHTFELAGKASAAAWLSAVLDVDQSWTLLGKTIVVGDSYMVPKEVRAYRLPDSWSDYIVDDIGDYFHTSVDGDRWAMMGGENELAVVAGWLIVKADTGGHYRLAQHLEVLLREDLDAHLTFSPAVEVTCGKLKQSQPWQYDRLPRLRLAKDLASVGVPTAILIGRMEDRGAEAPALLSWPPSKAPLWARFSHLTSADEAKEVFGETDSGKSAPVDWGTAVVSGGVLVFTVDDDEEVTTAAACVPPLALKTTEQMAEFMAAIGSDLYWDDGAVLHDRATVGGSLDYLIRAELVFDRLSRLPSSDQPSLQWLYTPAEFGLESATPTNWRYQEVSVAAIGVADLLPYVAELSLRDLIYEAGILIQGATLGDKLICAGRTEHIHQAAMLLIGLRQALKEPDNAFPIELLLPIHGHDEPLTYEELTELLERSRPKTLVSSVVRPDTVGKILHRIEETLGGSVQTQGEVTEGAKINGHLLLNVHPHRIAEILTANSDAWDNPFKDTDMGRSPLLERPHRRIVLLRPPPLPDVLALRRWEPPEGGQSEWARLVDPVGHRRFSFGQFASGPFPPPSPPAPWIAAINMAGNQHMKNTAVQQFGELTIVSGGRAARVDRAIHALGSLHDAPLRLESLSGWNAMLDDSLPETSVADAISELAARAKTPIVVQGTDAVWSTRASVSGGQTLGRALQSLAEKVGKTFVRRGGEAWLVNTEGAYGTQRLDASAAMRASGMELRGMEDMLHAAIQPLNWVALRRAPPTPFTPMPTRPMPMFGCTLPVSETELLIVHRPEVRRQVAHCLDVLASHPDRDELATTQWLTGDDRVKRGLALWDARAASDPTSELRDVVNQVLRTIDPADVDRNLVDQVTRAMLAWDDPLPDFDHCTKLLNAIPASSPTAQMLLLLLMKTREGGELVGKRLLGPVGNEDRSYLLSRMDNDSEGFDGALPYLLRLSASEPNALTARAQLTTALLSRTAKIKEILEQWSFSGVAEQQEWARGARAYLAQVGVELPSNDTAAPSRVKQ